MLLRNLWLLMLISVPRPVMLVTGEWQIPQECGISVLQECSPCVYCGGAGQWWLQKCSCGIVWRSHGGFMSCKFWLGLFLPWGYWVNQFGLSELLMYWSTLAIGHKLYWGLTCICKSVVVAMLTYCVFCLTLWFMVQIWNLWLNYIFISDVESIT